MMRGHVSAKLKALEKDKSMHGLLRASFSTYETPVERKETMDLEKALVRIRELEQENSELKALLSEFATRCPDVASQLTGKKPTDDDWDIATGMGGGHAI